MPGRVVVLAGPMTGVLLALAGCAGDIATQDTSVTTPSTSASASAPSTTGSPAPTATGTAARTPSGPASTPQRTPEPTREPSTSPSATPDGPQPSDGKPVDAWLTIPKIGIENLKVVAYKGWTDDGPGTVIQNRGVAASPHGPRGGTGPGGIGNYQVTAHRLSSTQAFRNLPRLRNGDEVHVVARGVRYTYRVADTRETSFRSERSLLEQRAAVPGRPGVEPTQAMITLSTCATPEDDAAGNYWRDRFGNPEHRIDKIGLLVATRPVR